MASQPVDACPAAEELRAFTAGGLPDDELARLGEHLDRCPVCFDAVAAPDPFTQSLRRIHQEGVSPWSRSTTVGAAGDGPYFFNVGDGPPTRDAEAFFDALRQSRLFDADDIKYVRREWKAFRSADLIAFAETLVLQGRLTEFHVRQLLRGKTRGWSLGDYVVLHPSSAGGLGWVYKAYHRRLKRTFALKVTPPHLTRSLSAVKRFRREIETIAKLHHPRLVAAVDAGEADGIDFLVMDELPGHSLAEWVELNGPIRAMTAVDMIREAAEGIAAAHEAGVIHRDLKPSNLWIETFAGASRRSASTVGVRVLDFGMARMAALDASRSSSGAGPSPTSPYAAPEQIRGGRPADSRSDIYSLGCCLSFLLSGKDPTPGSPAAALESPREPIPEALQTIYRRLTAASPSDRYATADDAIADLDAFLAGAAVSAHRPRRWLWATLAAAVAIAGLVLWFARFGGSAGPAIPAPPTAAPR